MSNTPERRSQPSFTNRLAIPPPFSRRVKADYAQRFHFQVLPSLGFNNTVRDGGSRRGCTAIHIATLSEAAKYAPEWRAAFGYEFMERPDGYPGLAKAYGLHFAGKPRILDLGLLYRALLAKQVDIVAGNSTDGLIAARDLTILQDDKRYFPPYNAVPVIRQDTLARYPEVEEALSSLVGKISDAEMRNMNYQVAGQGRDISEVAREFLRSKGIEPHTFRGATTGPAQN